MLAGSRTLTASNPLRERLTNALQISSSESLSFVGIQTIACDFVFGVLAPAVMTGDGSGRLLTAVSLDPKLRDQLDSQLRDVGLLLLCEGLGRPLGATDRLSEVLGIIQRDTRPSPTTVADALGIGHAEAEADLAVLASWGLTGRRRALPLAA